MHNAVYTLRSHMWLSHYIVLAVAVMKTMIRLEKHIFMNVCNTKHWDFCWLESQTQKKQTWCGTGNHIFVVLVIRVKALMGKAMTKDNAEFSN